VLAWLLVAVCRRPPAVDLPAFVEFGLNISPDVRISLRQKLNESGQVERLDVVLDPDGTSWDLLQAGAGYITGSMKHCKPVGKLIIELRRPTEGDSPLAKAILAVGSISVDLRTRGVRCGAGLEVVPCTDTVAVWRQLALVKTMHDGEGRFDATSDEGKVIEKRRVPYRRFGVVVAFAHNLNVAQFALLEKVRFPKLCSCLQQ
jgi:hypothetical protein